MIGLEKLFLKTQPSTQEYGMTGNWLFPSSLFSKGARKIIRCRILIGYSSRSQ